MNRIPAALKIESDNFFLQVYLDSFNKRIRIDDCRGNTAYLIEKAEELALEHQAEKLIFKVRSEQLFSFVEYGFQTEAVADRYFLGSDAYFCTKYYSASRRQNDQWVTEDQLLKRVCKDKSPSNSIVLPQEYQLERVDEKSSGELAALYQKVFQIYPTPLYDPEYVKKTMNDGTIYYVFKHNKKIVSAASAEVNQFYKNAELTDCATLPEHRKYGLMKMLLRALEQNLMTQGVFCCYSIARSLSYGMNTALYQLGYKYRGRLLNNCFIYDKLEDMNMWVKDLSKS
jgi:putative beta-lysine N-acetyltransferase